MTGKDAPVARILIVAGSDSGGGAGIQADLRTVTMLGGHPMTAITAITAQNTLGVQGVHAIPTEMVLAQIESVAGDIGVDAVKIGMIGSARTAEALAQLLERWKKAGSLCPVIFDPVMVSTSGGILADGPTIDAFGRLMALASLTTPNIPELQALGGADVVLRTGSALLVKGGHLEGDDVIDRLLDSSGEVARWEGRRIMTQHSHGTGCTLASGIATGLAQGLDLPAAITRAVSFVRAALANAPGLGKGHGPMGHALGLAPFDRLGAQLGAEGADA